jgi:hypothetical protein
VRSSDFVKAATRIFLGEITIHALRAWIVISPDVFGIPAGPRLSPRILPPTTIWQLNLGKLS